MPRPRGLDLSLDLSDKIKISKPLCIGDPDCFGNYDKEICIEDLCGEQCFVRCKSKQTVEVK
jgi:hypothetical protein